MRRRDFLKAVGLPALAGVGVNTILGGLQASEAAASDYKALVCVFLSL